VDVSLLESTERYSTPSRFRRPATIPAEHLSLHLPTGTDSVEKKIAVGPFLDTVTLRRIDPDVPLEQTFEFVDEDSPQRGDYYYIRVRQTNGGMAWSSPIWVGGYAPQ
jgi:hypothetical protein